MPVSEENERSAMQSNAKNLESRRLRRIMGPILVAACLLSPLAVEHGSTRDTANSQFEAGRLAKQAPFFGLPRNPFHQPFASNSIWNHPIGTEAERVPAELRASTQFGVFVEEEIIILKPHAPLTPIYENHADWQPGADRTSRDGPLLARLPIPGHFTTRDHVGATPNHAAAILRRNGRTLHNSQPFTRARAGEFATSHYVYPPGDLYGPGRSGAHGGSGLSALGGTIRLGELVPGGRIPHALKLVIDGRWLHYCNDATPGWRWPASKADGHASSWTYTGDVPALEMGALLALPPNFPIERLSTEPGRIVARALRDYGAYVCDNAGWDAYYLATEWSPDGRVIDEFHRVWGFSFVMPDTGHPWSLDFALLIEALHVVDNNGPNRIGGGGVPRQPLPPPLRRPPTRLKAR